ncbi:hypothetical protein K435DRAFT_856523 [Dendrothele bispora CBS 962.96]|uniref:Uncharacterized protein n=1 Tax=Dendrothele bispora (strain CBS 962.96) TaxID=1314807 RepID=A0A4S8M843_DENBC|nr:hypothetical protein K435DRAFT_856523 [Dendrothele bispora CBS 962.96]
MAVLPSLRFYFFSSSPQAHHLRSARLWPPLYAEAQARQEKILSLKLARDQISGTSTSFGLSTSIDPKSYLTSLNSVILKSGAKIGDIKRAECFSTPWSSLIPHARLVGSPLRGWKNTQGRMVAARKLIKQGYEQCQKREDVWLEAARLHVRTFSPIPGSHLSCDIDLASVTLSATHNCHTPSHQDSSSLCSARLRLPSLP